MEAMRRVLRYHQPLLRYFFLSFIAAGGLVWSELVLIFCNKLLDAAPKTITPKHLLSTVLMAFFAGMEVRYIPEQLLLMMRLALFLPCDALAYSVLIYCVPPSSRRLHRREVQRLCMPPGPLKERILHFYFIKAICPISI